MTSRLPVEILGNIFLLTAMEQESDLRFPVDLSQIPWILGRVCAQWRAVARAETRLWDKLEVTVKEPEHLQKGISFLHHILPPSRCPLSICLNWNIEDSAIGSLISPYLRRFQKFHLRIHDHACYALADIPPEEFDSIVDFSLTVLWKPRVPPSEEGEEKLIAFLQGFTTFDCMQSLQKLHLASPGFWPGAQALVFQNPYVPFHQLTHLDLGDLTCVEFDELIPLLRKCVPLQSFVVPSLYPDTELSIMENEELLPNLTSANLTLDTDDIISAYYIPIPWGRLTRLSLTYHIDSIAEDNVFQILDLLEKTSRLEVLRLEMYLDDGECEPDRMITFNHLRTLIISPGDHWVFAHLIAPNLCELYVHHYEGGEDSLEGKFEVLFTRSGCAPRTIKIRR